MLIVADNPKLLNFSSILFSDETELLAKNLGLRLFQTSVKEDLNVSNVFRYLATKCHEIIKQQYNSVLTINTPSISQYNPTFHSKASGTIVLTRPLRKSKRKSMLKKCGLI